MKALGDLYDLGRGHVRRVSGHTGKSYFHD